jgi:peptide deformylase
MSQLEILKYPDPRLRKKCLAVESVTPELKKLAEDMLQVMYDSRGIGLAAAQVNHQVRLLVADIRPREGGRYKTDDMTDLEKKAPMPFVIFNPVILKKDGKTTYDEGCLSVPTYFETVERAKEIEIQGLDIDGKEFTVTTDGLLAICLQHEIDHLDGKLFIDRLTPIRANRLKAKIKKFGYPDPTHSTTDTDEQEVEL